MDAQLFMKAFKSLNMGIGMEEVMRLFRNVGTNSSGKAAVSHLMHCFSSDFPALFGSRLLDFEQTATQMASANGIIEFGEFYNCLLKLSLDVSRDESFEIFEEALRVCNSPTLAKNTVSVSTLSAFIHSSHPDLLSRKKPHVLSSSLPVLANPVSTKKRPQSAKLSSSLIAIKSTEKVVETERAMVVNDKDKSNQGDSRSKKETAGSSIGNTKKRPQSAKLSSLLIPIKSTEKVVETERTMSAKPAALVQCPSSKGSLSSTL